jgi:hypothetical protein
MLNYDSAMPAREATADLARLVYRIAELRRKREAIYRAATLDLFFAVHGEADSIDRTLAGIRFASRALDTVWAAAMKRVVAYWQEQIPRISYFHLNDVERIRQFVEDHPAYPQLDVEKRKAVEVTLVVNEVTIERLVDSTRDLLKTWLKDDLEALQAEA